MKTPAYSRDDFLAMSYPDFVGFINQWNVLPGAHTTLSKWQVYSQITARSNLLEIACTTGFSSREIALATGCRGKAFDLSKTAIHWAIRNKEIYAPDIRIQYFVQDGYRYRTKEFFSHIIIGASLLFFPRPEEMLAKCVRWLRDGGCVLASPFYVTSPIPPPLVRRFRKVFGIAPTTVPYKTVMRMYQGLEVLYEDRNDLEPETDEEMEHYCHSTIRRVYELGILPDHAYYDVLYRRLLEIKRMSNALRPYQRYAVLVLRYRRCVYPNRFVELF